MEQHLNIEELKENISHGNSLFPFYVYKNQGDKNILTHHWHEEIEFIFLKKGKAIFYLDSISFALNPGEVLIANSGVIHSGKAVKKSQCHFYSVVFDLKMLNSRFEDECQIKYLSPLVNKKARLRPRIRRENDWGERVLELLEEIIAVFYQKEKGYELKIKSLLYLILYNFIASNNLIKVKEKDYKKERLKKVLKFIHNNYQKNIKLKELAEEINLSKYYFCRFFKNHTGTTPVEYLNFYRINKAAEMLQETDKQIMDIALEVGFSNNSYFIKVFKDHLNCTPSEYRRRKHSFSK